MKKIFALIALASTVLFTSCLKDEMYGGATISGISNTIAYTELNPVTVSATVTSLVGITDVNLVYAVNGGTENTIPMTLDGDKYFGVIPAQAKDSEVEYHITVATVADMTAESAVVKYKVGATPIDYKGLKLNELNGNDKFIELVNNGKNDIPVAGVTIQKDGAVVWTAPSKVLAPGEFILLYSADVTASHPEQPADLFFTSGLSAKKAVRVQLFDPSGNSLDDFNLVNCAKTAAASYSKNADGQWYHAEATPGAKNVEGTEIVEGLEGGPAPKVPGSVILNELNGNTKFIELYNPGDEDFAIAGYTIQKDGTLNWTAPAGCTVKAKGFLLLYSADVTADHPEQPAELFFSSGLSAKKAVKIELFDDKATSVEAFNLVTVGKTAPASYSKNADGKWYFADATPGAANVEGTEAVTGLE